MQRKDMLLLELLELLLLAGCTQASCFDFCAKNSDLSYSPVPTIPTACTRDVTLLPNTRVRASIPPLAHTRHGYE